MTIIEIFPDKDGLNKFLEIDEIIFEMDNNDKFSDMPIYILQYPYENSSVSYGVINNISEYNIEYRCSTQKGSSGSPILSLGSLKVIGIHKGSSKESFIERTNFRI